MEWPPVTNAIPEDGGQPIAFSSELTAGRLPNGLTYYVRKNGEPQQRAELRLVVRVGSTSEQEHERGIAHVIEHLAFRATEAFGKFELVAFMESIGAQFGACQNAYTSFEETVYELHIPVDDADNQTLRKSLGVLKEWACKVRISDQDLEDERNVVMEEYRQSQTSQMRASVAYSAALAGKDSIYSQRLPIGLPAVIEGVDGETLRQFYSRYYVPQNQAVVCVGDFSVDESEVVAMIGEIFGGIAAAPLDAPAPVAMAAWSEHPRTSVLILPDEETTSSSVSVDVQQARLQVRSEADYRTTVVKDLFHRAVNNRLYKCSIRSNEQWQRSIDGTGDTEEELEEGEEGRPQSPPKRMCVASVSARGEMVDREVTVTHPNGTTIKVVSEAGCGAPATVETVLDDGRPADDAAAAERDGVGLGLGAEQRRGSLGLQRLGNHAPIVSGSSSSQNPVPPLETMQVAAGAQQHRELQALRCILLEIERGACVRDCGSAMP
jgi:hypothetical protein